MDSVLKQMLLPNYYRQVMTPFIKIKKNLYFVSSDVSAPAQGGTNGGRLLV